MLFQALSTPDSLAQGIFDRFNRHKARALKRRHTQKYFVADRSVSITTEREFLAALDEIAANLGQSRAALVRSIGENHHMANLSAAIRIFVIEYYMNACGVTPSKEQA